MKVKELIYDARSLIDEYNSDGVVLSESETLETDTNALRYVYMGLGEIYPYARYFKTVEVVQTPTDEQKNAGNWLLTLLPDDLGTIDSAYIDDDKSQFDSISRLEGFNRLYITPQFEGKIRINYMPKPIRLGFEDDLPINNPVAEQYLTYYVAAKIAITELPDYANYFESKSIELYNLARKPQLAKEQQIVDVYGWR